MALLQNLFDTRQAHQAARGRRAAHGKPGLAKLDLVRIQQDSGKVSGEPGCERRIRFIPRPHPNATLESHVHPPQRCFAYGFQHPAMVERLHRRKIQTARSHKVRLEWSARILEPLQHQDGDSCQTELAGKK